MKVIARSAVTSLPLVLAAIPVLHASRLGLVSAPAVFLGAAAVIVVGALSAFLANRLRQPILLIAASRADKHAAEMLAASWRPSVKHASVAVALFDDVATEIDTAFLLARAAHWNKPLANHMMNRVAALATIGDHPETLGSDAFARELAARVMHDQVAAVRIATNREQVGAQSLRRRPALRRQSATRSAAPRRTLSAQRRTNVSKVTHSSPQKLGHLDDVLSFEQAKAAPDSISLIARLM